jgi:hypothetical protein
VRVMIDIDVRYCMGGNAHDTWVKRSSYVSVK